MAYEKQEWAGGDIIKAYNLNHIENGIYDESESAEQNASDIASNKESIEQNASDIASNKESIEQNASDIANNKEETDKAIEDLSKDVDDKYSEVNSALAELGSAFRVDSFTGSSTTIESGSYGSITISVTTPSGYTTLGAVGFNSGNSNLQVSRVNVSSNAGMTGMTVRNTGSSSVTVEPIVYILFVKTSLL